MPPEPFPVEPKTPPAKVTANAEQRQLGRLLASRAHKKAIWLGIGALVVIPVLMWGGSLLIDVPVLKAVVRFLFCFGPVMMLVVAIKTFTVRPHSYLYEGGIVTNVGNKYPVVTTWDRIGDLEPVSTKGTTARPGDEVWGHRTKTLDGKTIAWPTGSPEQDVFLRELMNRTAAAKAAQVGPAAPPYPAPGQQPPSSEASPKA